MACAPEVLWPVPGSVKVVGIHDNGTMVCVFAAALLRIHRSAASASVNQLTHALKKAPYDPNPRPQQTAANASKREGNHARQQDSNLCSVDHGASALLQGSPCFGDDHTKLSGTWKLVAFMTEDINNKVRENVCDKQAEGYLTFTDAGRVFGFATTKGGEPLASTPESYNASRPIFPIRATIALRGATSPQRSIWLGMTDGRAPRRCITTVWTATSGS